MAPLIPVVFQNGHFSHVPPRELDQLIAEERIIGFRRRDGWAILGEDPVRDPRHSHSYQGPERRRSV